MGAKVTRQFCGWGAHAPRVLWLGSARAPRALAGALAGQGGL